MHVAITGASRGIGAGLARAWARTGANLTLVARRREGLDGVAATVDSNVHLAITDLSDPAHALSWIPAAESALGPIDVLVNNAGRQVLGPAEAVSAHDAEASLALDLTVPIRLARHLGAAMLARGHGSIVNVASVAAFNWLPGLADYNAAKSGLAAWSETVRAEWAPRGVRVLTVYPGPVRTDMAAEAMDAFGPRARWLPVGTPDGLAEAVLAALAAHRPRVVYPAAYALLRAFPNLSRWSGARLAPMPRLGDSARR